VRSDLCFAAPSEELFVDDEYAGTVYLWNDGSTMTVWTIDNPFEFEIEVRPFHS
jgi:hypothetical protein